MASTTVEIARPPDEVFAFVTDPTKLSAWQSTHRLSGVSSPRLNASPTAAARSLTPSFA